MALKRKRSSLFQSPMSSGGSSSTTSPASTFIATPPTARHDRDASCSPTPYQHVRLVSDTSDDDMTMDLCGPTTEPDYSAGFTPLNSFFRGSGSRSEDKRARWGPEKHDGGNSLNSRTRKRFRNGRPDESAVHENTYAILFKAQQNLSAHPAPLPAASALAESPPNSRSSSYSSLPANVSHPERHQKSLHNFWPSLSSSAPPAPSALCDPRAMVLSRSNSSQHVRRCQDCDSNLSQPTSFAVNTDAMAMDVDMANTASDGFYGIGEEETWGCTVCKRAVCDLCVVGGAVGREGSRMCLACEGERARTGYEGRTKWVGGIGWVGEAYL
ncbi:hypothetical protein MMC25_007236 [Agyrium rufum]|nr:hypothetical protein [Agyrium rufum]